MENVGTFITTVVVIWLSCEGQTETIKSFPNSPLAFSKLNIHPNESIGNYKKWDEEERQQSVFIKKCCLPNESLSYKDSENISCLKSANDVVWKPILYKEPEEQLSQEVNVSFITVGLPVCKWTILDNNLDTWFNIMQDGNVKVGLNFWTIPLWLHPLEEKGYCLDSSWESNDTKNGSVLVFCELENFELYLAIRTGFGILFAISSISLLITIVIYALMWGDHSIHGWTQFSFFLSLFLYYAAEGSRIFAKLNGLKIKPTKTCFIHAIVAHYFTIVISGTGSMMCIDCFVTFWKLRSVRSKTKRELIIYLFLSWGVPLLALILGLYFHFINDPIRAELERNGVFEYAHYRCSSPVWKIAFTVQLFMLLVNVLAFLGAAFFILKHLKSTALAKANRQGSNKSWAQFKKTFTLFLKLFFITGVSWTLTTIDLFLGYKNPMGWPFILVRVYLSLQGIPCLIVFGLHRKNFVQIRKRYPKFTETYLVSWMTRFMSDRQRSISFGSRSQPKVQTLQNTSRSNSTTRHASTATASN